MDRQRLRLARWWLAANIAAIGTTQLLAIWLPLCGLALPLVVGIAQGLALRGRVRPALWVVATAGGFIVALIVGAGATIAFDLALVALRLAAPIPLITVAFWGIAALGGATVGAVQAFMGVSC